MKSAVAAMGLLMLEAQTVFGQYGNESAPEDPLKDIVMGTLPVLIFLLIICFTFISQIKRMRPNTKLQQEYYARSMEHMQRTEEMLKRIATSLEKGGKP